MSSQTASSKRKILIIGGGVGGLTLGQALLRHDIPFRIFERDNHSSYRAQGYRIRISGDGVIALQNCLPRPVWETLEASAAAGNIALTKLDALTGEEVKGGPRGPGEPHAPGAPPTSTGRVAMGGPGELKGMRNDVKPIAVDRTIMRQVLLTGLEEHVVFGKEFQQYEITDTGITAHFSDGTCDRGDFLVGADGVRSLVRKQYLPNVKVVDTEGRCIYGKTYITDSLTAQVNPNAQKNMTVIQQHLEDGTPLTLFLEPTRFPNPELVPILNPETGKRQPVKDYIYWVLLSRSNVFPHVAKDLVHLSPKEAAELSIQLTQEWHESFKPILEQQSYFSASALRISSAFPEFPSWTPSTRITLLGDAIHPIPPTGGLGAVSALRDVGQLVDVIVGEGITQASIGKYEDELRKWASEAVKGSMIAGEKFYGQASWQDAKPVDF